MKKSLLAIAVAAALPGYAQAQSSLTMFGILDASVQWANSDFNSGYNTVPGAAGKPPTIARSNGSTGFTLANGVGMGSRFGVRGTEDLGGGLRAIFTLEHRFDVTDGDTSGALGTAGGAALNGGAAGKSDANNVKFWNGQAWVGISSTQWGQVTAGRQYTPIFWALYPADFTAYAYYNNWAAPTGTTLNSVIPQGPVRADNSIAYKSPTFGGLTVYAMYAFGERLADGSYNAAGTGTAAVGTGDIMGIAAGWQLGGLYIGGGYHTIDNKASAVNGVGIAGVPTVGQSVGAITASYKWQSFGVSAGYTQLNFQQFYANTTNSANVNTILLSAFAMVGTGKVMFNGYSTNAHDFKSVIVNSAGQGLSVNNNSTFSYGLTYEYPLSKRTFMYVSGGQSDFSNFQVNGTNRLKPSAAALGFRHLF
ncbi:MAG: porin [Burkholderiales bacterium]